MAAGEGNLQVIRCWLVARAEFLSTGLFTPDRFRDLLANREGCVKTLSPAELEARVHSDSDDKRRHRFLNWNWRRQEIRLEDFGPWRTVGDGLPLQACKGSAVDAANFIRRYPEQPPGSLGIVAQQKYREAQRIRRLQHVAEVVRSDPFLSIIAAERCQRGREDCKCLRFSSEDGSPIRMMSAGRATDPRSGAGLSISGKVAV